MRSRGVLVGVSVTALLVALYTLTPSDEVATVDRGHTSLPHQHEEQAPNAESPAVEVPTKQPATAATRSAVEHTGVPAKYLDLCAGIESKGTWSFPNGNRSLPPKWVPKDTAGSSSCRPFRRFSQIDAVRCLEGKFVLMYGNSNTRTLYTALEALLKDQEQISRLAAKQRCDNSKKNHSCWMTIEPNATLAQLKYDAMMASGTVSPEEALQAKMLLSTHRPIVMFYWGYIKDIYDPSLESKMQHQRHADVVITNSQLNVVQATGSDKALVEGHKRAMPKFNQFAASFPKSVEHAKMTGHPSFFWHTTTPVCPNQKHFKRYRYQAKFWSGRTPSQTNAAIGDSNRYIIANVERTKIAVIDSAAMVDDIVHGGPQGEQLLCPHYDDPLHHRFLDSEIVQVFLNKYCG